MTSINYTHDFQGLDSSLVYDVWYDGTTGTAYLNLEDTLYAYEGVTHSAVEALVNAPSIGGAYNGGMFRKGFKQNFGPGIKVGNAGTARYVKRTPTAPGRVDKNLSYAEDAVVDGQPVGNSTGEHISHGTVHGTPIFGMPGQISTNTVHAQPIKRRIPLRAAEQDKPADKRAMTVHFESNGSRTYTLDAATVDEAVDALREVAEMLGVKAKVTGVFVHFE